MKKLIATLLVLASMLCACGGGTATPTISRGETTDTSYTNGSIGLTFHKPSDWSFLTEEELAQFMNLTVEDIRSEFYLEKLKIATFIDFLAIQNSSGDQIRLTLENLRLSAGDSIPTESYADQVKEGMQIDLENVELTFGDYTPVILGGQEYLRLDVQYTLYGDQVRQYLYFRKVHNYMVLINAYSIRGTSAETFEKMFS